MIPVMKPWMGDEEAQAAAAAVASGWVAQGPRVAEFERALARHVGAQEGVAVSSCTAALHLALTVAGVRPGDEVIVPSLSFIATANVVRYVGAKPVFADVDPSTANLTPATIAPVLGDRTVAVLLVHQAGMPADVDAVRGLCEPRGVSVLEDAACAIGSRYRGAPVGGHSPLVAFSFHPRKILTTGEGGMLMTSRPQWATRARQLREHGMSVSATERHRSDRYVFEQYFETGFNYRMTDIQAAVGIVQLRRLEAMVARRRELAARYIAALGNTPGLQLPSDPVYGETNYQSFWVVLPSGETVGRNEVLQRMTEMGVSPRRGIMASHLEPAFSDRAGPELPETERFTHRSLILPLYHEMTDADQDRVIDTFLKATGLDGPTGG